MDIRNTQKNHMTDYDIVKELHEEIKKIMNKDKTIENEDILSMIYSIHTYILHDLEQKEKILNKIENLEGIINKKINSVDDITKELIKLEYKIENVQMQLQKITNFNTSLIEKFIYFVFAALLGLVTVNFLKKFS